MKLILVVVLVVILLFIYVNNSKEYFRNLNDNINYHLNSNDNINFNLINEIDSGYDSQTRDYLNYNYAQKIANDLQ